MNRYRKQPHRLAALAVGLLALAFALPPAFAGEVAARTALVAEGKGHVATLPRHTARFDGTALEITGQADAATKPGPQVRFELEEVRQGGMFLAGGGGAPVRVDGKRIAYGRGSDIEERYEVRPDGIEQTFRLARPLPGRGDLVLTGALSADRELGRSLPDGAGGLVIPLGDGGSRLRYGAVTAIDAKGARRAGTLAVADGRVTLTVDGAWLATAAYPVVVDPLIWIERNVRFQSRPAVAFDFGGSAAGPGATPARYLVAYEADNTAGAPKQIWGRMVQWNGTALAIPGGDPSYGANISADPSAAHSQPAVAFKFGSLTSPKRNYLVAWQRSDRNLGYRILDGNGAPLTPPRKIVAASLTIHQDVAAAAAPRGGWGASACGTTLGCTPYVLVYRGVYKTTLDISSLRLALIDDGNGALVSDRAIESLGVGDDPLSAPQIAYGHSAGADYYLLVYRRPNGQIVARKVNTAGGVGAAYVVASTSNGPPVVAYSLASNRWGVFWRANASRPLLGPAVTIQGQTFDGNRSWEPLVPVGSRITVVQSSLPEFSRPQDVLPDYAAAGSQTAVEYAPYQGFFEVAYTLRSTTTDAFSLKVFTGGTLSAATRLTTDAKDDRFIDLASTRIDPLTTPLSCTGAPSSRCALWVLEHFFSPTDHDISGLWTQFQY